MKKKIAENIFDAIPSSIYTYKIEHPFANILERVFALNLKEGNYVDTK